MDVTIKLIVTTYVKFGTSKFCLKHFGMLVTQTLQLCGVFQNRSGIFSVVGMCTAVKHHDLRSVTELYNY